MTFLRVLHAEILKMRRTIAWKMAILAPGIVVLLAFFAAWQAPFSTVNRFGPGHGRHFFQPPRRPKWISGFSSGTGVPT